MTLIMVTPVYSLRILLLNLDDANRIKINPGKENSFPSRGSLFYPQDGSLSPGIIGTILRNKMEGSNESGLLK